MVNSMSVAVGDIEMTRVGFAASVVPSSVTGNAAFSLVAAGVADAWFVEPLDAHPLITRPASAAAASIATGVCLCMSTSCRSRLQGASPTGRLVPACEAPLLESAFRDRWQATWLIPRDVRGHHSCGTAPESHRLRCVTISGTVAHPAFAAAIHAT